MASTKLVVVVVLLQTIMVVYCGDPLWRDPVTGKGWYSVEQVDAGGSDYETAICSTLHCRKGEECVLRDRVAVCQCRKSCPHHDRPVCASDGITYPSHCHLHREACVSGKRLHTVRHGPCSTETAKEWKTSLLSANKTSETNVTGNWNEKTTTWERPSTKGTAFLDTTTVSAESSTVPSPEYQVDPSVDAAVATATTSFPHVTPPVRGTTIPMCSNDDFIYVPNNLLLYFHAKYSKSGATGPSEKGKSYLVHLIYNHLDLNADRILTVDELQHAEQERKYAKLLPSGCHLTDLMNHADNDGDGQLNEKEFFRMFGLPVAFISPHNEIKIHRVEVGQQYQLFCDIEKFNTASLKVTWYRYDVPLVNVAPYDFEVSADGSLYLTPASLTHNGNFSCRVPFTVTNGPFSVPGSSELTTNVLQQVHVVNVFEQIRVSITPDFLLLKTGENGYLRCDVDGYPASKIIWDKNGRPFRENVSVLQLMNVRTYDTGSYTCRIPSAPDVGTNGNGELTRRTASVVVRDRYDQPEMSLRFNTRHQGSSFFVLYESGVRLYRADDCTLLHAIPSSYPTKEEKQGYLCHDRRCRWSEAVVTQPPVYLYASLPEQMVVVKINVTSGGVEQIFHLNHIPKRLRYIDWEDTIWVEAWHDENGNYKTIQTVRSASKTMRHALTHALPLRDEFDAIHRLFLPSYGKLKYGYITHREERALHKIDLHSLKIVSRVSLVPYDCQPSEMAFVAQAGLAVVQCSSTSQATGNSTSGGGGQLILDCISDAALVYDSDIHGIPVVTEDGKWIINIDTILGRIFVHKVDEKGVPLVATIDEFLPINDWTLHPSITLGSWDLYAAPRSGTDLIKINIPGAKLERLPGSKDASRERTVVAISTHRRNRYLAGATSESVFVVDLFNSNTSICHIRLNGTERIVWTK